MRLIVSLPLSLGIGLAAGFGFFRGPAPLARSAASALREKDSSSDAAASPGSTVATDEKAQRLVAAALRKSGSEIDRDNELYLAIEALTADDFRRLLVDFGALKAMAEKLSGIGGETRQNLTNALVARWLAVDPDAVTAWAPRVVELIPAKEDVRTFILCALAAKRPEQMLALAQSCKNADDRAEMLAPALFELTMHNSAKARAWLDACTDAADRRVAEKSIRKAAVQADPARAVEFASAIADRQEASELLRIATDRAAKMGPDVLRQLATTPMPAWMLTPVLIEFADREPDLAVDLAIKSGGGDAERNSALNWAFSALARRDPAQAIAKLDGLEGQQLAAAVSAIGTRWAARDPAQALAWLAERPALERKSESRWSYGTSDSLRVAFGEWVERDGGAARAWADALPAGETRDDVQTHLARVLAERGEPAEAVQVLARLGHAADPKAIGDLARAWAGRDPKAAADWAIAQPTGAVQSRAIASVVGSWANDDPHAVEDWLAQFPPGETRDHSIAAFLSRSSNWISGNETHGAEFDAWFDSIEDPWQRTQAAVQSFWTRRDRDPAGARAWLASVPNVDAEVVRMTLRKERN